MLVLLRPRVSSRVSGFPVASPCLWGKLQNLSFSKVSKQGEVLCASLSYQVTLGSALCKLCSIKRLCASFVVQSSTGKCFVQALWYNVWEVLCASFVVQSSTGKCFCASSVVQSSTGKSFVQALWYKVVLGSALCKLCSTKWYWEVLCASFVVQTSTGKSFVQALWYKVVPGSALCKLCSTK